MGILDTPVDSATHHGGIVAGLRDRIKVAATHGKLNQFPYTNSRCGHVLTAFAIDSGIVSQF
ncbi:hypothetical protein FC50_GL000334 [Lacticaseibacillus pantheris DSM 15945 = JCM 12539 = NBRC 106106]|uniref:Uncharacterized protein n=1 Tax=Lacticaseibacillus pantheris DSM 15945 = JCM 12539 = NBRC 106106 TaxID=1423783 RepID=A0A0R1UA41_9LACO|nr:hypothetical protein FC50_GL000334 [Lacticaseibacillus pantheris DSM 15945 = JCM 12539 = NBRC 106106]